MAVDLGDYADSLRREITPVGTTLGIQDDELTAYLTDAFWEARLDGFLEGYIADEDGLVEHEGGGRDLDRRYVALVVLYAGIRILRNRILNTNTSFRAKAGPVEFEQQSSATMLAEMLKQLRGTKDRIIEALDADETNVQILDAMSVRMFNGASYWGSPELMG